MSKKTLLNEHTIRRFGGLAGIKPAVTSNFLTEVEVGEDELADALAAGAEAMADTLGLPVSVEVEASEEGDELEGEEEMGFGDEEELEGEEEMGFGDEEELEGEEDFEAGEEEFEGGEEEELEGEEETLDELINRILQEDEDDDEDTLEEDTYRDIDEFEAGEKEEEEELKEKARSDKTIHQKTGAASKKGEKNERGTGSYYQEGRIKVVDDEYIMQEVSRRVKHRLANLVKESRRRKRPTKRRK